MSLNATTALAHLRSFIQTIDKGWGIKPEDSGLHSIRSSTAMGMYLNKIPVYTTMLLGCWSSDTFLRFIRKQVTEFSNNVLKMVIQIRRITTSRPREGRTFGPITQWPHPRIWVWAPAARPLIATCSRFGHEATSLHELHEYKSGAMRLQHAYASPAERFAQRNLDHGGGHSFHEFRRD